MSRKKHLGWKSSKIQTANRWIRYPIWPTPLLTSKTDLLLFSYPILNYIMQQSTF